jgi:hypothetical protein
VDIGGTWQASPSSPTYQGKSKCQTFLISVESIYKAISCSLTMRFDDYILNFKVLGKQLFSIRVPLASCSMRISFHFFCKACMTNINIFIA